MIRVNVAGRAGIFTLPPLDSYEHTIANGIGFESCTTTFKGSIEDYNSCSRNLMSDCACSGPDAERIWEGKLVQVDGTFGQEQRSVSVGDGFANSVKVRYTTVLDSSGFTSFYSDATSIARYGTRQEILTVGKITGNPPIAATTFAQKELKRRKNPVAKPSTQVATGSGGDMSITLHWAGIYTFLDWLVTQITDTSTQQTTDQVKSLLTAYNLVNNWFSGDQSRITASGVVDTKKVDQDTTYRAKIEALLGQGNSSYDRLVWGVYENKKFVVKPYNQINPYNYFRNLGSSAIYNEGGILIAPWIVRPGAIYTVADLTDNSSSSYDTGNAFYVERVTCSVSGDSVGVTLESSNTDSVDAIISRIK